MATYYNHTDKMADAAQTEPVAPETLTKDSVEGMRQKLAQALVDNAKKMGEALENILSLQFDDRQSLFPADSATGTDTETLRHAIDPEYVKKVAKQASFFLILEQLEMHGMIRSVQDATRAGDDSGSVGSRRSLGGGAGKGAVQRRKKKKRSSRVTKT